MLQPPLRRIFEDGGCIGVIVVVLAIPLGWALPTFAATPGADSVIRGQMPPPGLRPTMVAIAADVAAVAAPPSPPPPHTRPGPTIKRPCGKLGWQPPDGPPGVWRITASMSGSRVQISNNHESKVIRRVQLETYLRAAKPC